MILLVTVLLIGEEWLSLPMLLKTSLLRQFLTLKGYSAISVFLDQSGKYGFKSMQYICQFTSLYFRIIPDEFRCLSGENLLLGVTPENF